MEENKQKPVYDFARRMGVDMESAKQKSEFQWYAHCPFCHKGRKAEHQGQREFWFTTATGHYQCFNCGQEGRLDTETFYRIAESGGQVTKHMMKLKRYEKELGIKVLERATTRVARTGDDGNDNGGGERGGDNGGGGRMGAGPHPYRGTQTWTNMDDRGENDHDGSPAAVIDVKNRMKLRPQDWEYFHKASMEPATNEKVLDYLAGRKIYDDTIELLKVGSDIQNLPGTAIANDCVVFNYFLDGEIVNQKFRFIKVKMFSQTPDCDQVPYNIDSLKCEKDAQGKRPPVIIVEGEMDVLSLVASGYERVISIPNGAMSNLDWVERFWTTHFEGVSEYVLAVDMDRPGQELAKRLAERFGPAICKRADFVECKDSNEYLMKYDEIDLRDIIDGAPLYPLPGIVEPKDIHEEVVDLFFSGAPSGVETGWVRHYDPVAKSWSPLSMDNFVTWETRQLALMTGRSGDGKSEFLDEIVVRLNLHAGWKAAYFTPENSPLYHHETKLLEKIVGKRFPQQKRKADVAYMNEAELYQGLDYIEKNFHYINPPVNEMKIDTILKSADYVVQRYGIKILVLDPYNYIEKEMEREWQLNQWDSQTVSKIRDFAVSRNLLCFLIAHPRKVYENDKDGNRRRIEMSDISGTADFGNKADYCIVVDRNKDNDMTTVFIDKVRNKDLGDRGIFFMMYYSQNGRFIPTERILWKKDTADYKEIVGEMNWDQSNWLDVPPFHDDDEAGSGDVAVDDDAKKDEELPF